MHTLQIIKVLFACLLVSFVFATFEVVPEDITDYYWREYTGVIPTDAIPGGTDKSGKKLYIGQMYLKEFGLLPATIYPESKVAWSSAAGGSISSGTYVKILCSRNHEKYQWIPTRNEDSHLLTDCHFVIGGTEDGYILNIGRANHDMETVVGKIFAHHTPWRGLTLHNKKKTYQTYQSYEILTYNCNLNQYILNVTFTTV